MRVFFKYVPKTGTGMHQARLTDYVPIRPLVSNSGDNNYIF